MPAEGPKERWRRVDAIMDEMLPLSPPERSRYLDARFDPGDPIRREVEELLASDEQASELLDDASPLPDRYLTAGPPKLELGSTVGPYRLESVLGHGGMGTVYLAHRDDEQFDRKVALKVAEGGIAEDSSWRDFKRERQILARLEHPNIARLYDGGSTADGRPYLVMEHVSGVPITAYARGRPIPELLRLFLQVCAAVQHAHQNLLVHCDIKPNNVLVDSTGTPKLLDFGIARLLASDPARTASQTPAGLFTPAFAAPEQLAGGSVTTATDIFALGVLLYLLLTGEHPFEVDTPRLGEIERSILSGRVTPPSARGTSGDPTAEVRRRLLRGDLDNIVLTALRLEPRLRYPSVAALARDIECHLQDLPITARPDTAAYRLRKFVRRHRWGTLFSVLLLLLGVGFSATVALQRSRIERERDRADRQRVEAELQRDRSERALAILMELLESALTDPESDDRIDPQHLLRQAYRRVSRDLSDLPETRAQVLDRIATIYAQRGQYAEALAVREDSAQLLLGIYGESDPTTLRALVRLADAHRAVGRFQEAEELARRALEATGSGDPAHRNVAGEALTLLGSIYDDEGLPHEALSCHLESLARREGPGASSPRESARARTLVAGALRSLGRFEESELAHRTAIATLRESPDAGLDLVEALDSQALLLVDRGRLDEAQESLEEASAILGDLALPSRPLLARTSNHLGLCLILQGRHQRGERLLARALALARDEEGTPGPLLGRVLLNRGILQLERNAPAEALQPLAEAQTVLEATLGPGHLGTAEPMLARARASRLLGDLDTAVTTSRRALALRCQLLPSRHWQIAEAEGELGEALWRRTGSSEGRALIERSAETLANIFPATDHRVRQAQRRLALVSAPSLDR